MNNASFSLLTVSKINKGFMKILVNEKRNVSTP